MRAAMNHCRLAALVCLVVWGIATQDDASAHPSVYCEPKFGWVTECNLVYDWDEFGWKKVCSSVFKIIKYDCRAVPHSHFLESAQARDERVLREVAAALRSAVESAVAECEDSSGDSEEVYDSCMEANYPETAKHLAVLRKKMTDEVGGSGEMTENGPLYGEDGEQGYGKYSLDSKTIEIDVNIHILLESDVSARNEEIFDTIIHEKLHYEDWQDDTEDWDETKVITMAADIVEELLSFLKTAEIDWEQQDRVIYGPFH